MIFFFVAIFFIILGTTYVKGYDVVKSRSPEHLVHFYMIMATIRLLLVATLIALYVFYASNRGNATNFAAIVLAMYAMMMVITLFLRH